MAARDKYTINFKCPKCSEKGVLHLSEDDYPFMKRLNREVDDVEGKFSASMDGELDIKVICNACGEIFTK